MIEFISQPWPWYIAGPLIGLMVPLLLWLDNKRFGISSNLRHICATCAPRSIEYFNYNWKNELWNLFFLGGIIIGGILAATIFSNPNTIELNSDVIEKLNNSGINNLNGLMPEQIFGVENIFTLRSLSFTFFGGFLVGFGTRYANGCTSGHSITGLSALQWPSLIATVCFMVGGFISANFIVPFLLSL